MNFFEQLEDDVLARLSILEADDIDVENFPELFKGIQPVHDKPRVSVLYSHEKGKNRMDISIVSQETDVQVIIKIDAMRRRGDKGLYDCTERVRLLLLGYKPVNCMVPFTFVEGSYPPAEDLIKGQVWSYYATFQTSRPIVEDLVDIPFPKVKTIDTYNPLFDGSFHGSWDGSV